MIGVIPKADQLEVVEEFFEFFKTPWEIYRLGHVYDVVIATADEMPDVRTKLLLVSGPVIKRIDDCIGITVGGRNEGVILSDASASFPIYGPLLTFENGGKGSSCVMADSKPAVLRINRPDGTVIRLGYDLFDEVRFLISSGQPVEHAHSPTLEIHVRMLREWILGAGLPLIEIPPAPAGHSFVVCLTHDIDFVGIRRHFFDHSAWGFLYRATAGNLYNFARGRLSLASLAKSWYAAVSLPFVYAGWARDFWEPFEWYLAAERDLPTTYFLIPFKRRPGEKVSAPHAARRAVAYDVSELQDWVSILQKNGCEVGVHGLDAWHSADKARDELEAVAAVAGESCGGIRMHWLLRDASTPSVLESAGYAYDSTFGYNETVGYLAGTTQVFRPLGAQTLLELPLHVQDGALFYRRKLGLSESEAERCCQTLIDNVRKFGGVFTILWHDRSPGPERFWGRFYLKLLQRLRSLDGWFGTAAQVVNWFRRRRSVRFEQIEGPGGVRTLLRYEGEEIEPPLRIRFYLPSRPLEDGDPVYDTTKESIDVPWNGKFLEALDCRVRDSLSIFMKAS